MKYNKRQFILNVVVMGTLGMVSSVVYSLAITPTSGTVGGVSGFNNWGQCQSGGTTLSVVGRLLPTPGKSVVAYNDSSVSGEVYNNSNTPQTITLVSYKEFYPDTSYDDKVVNGVFIPGQRVNNYQTVTVAANGHVNLTAQLPGCSTQIDLVCGEVNQYLGKGNLYNARKLAYYHAHQPSNGWCNSTGVIPWDSATAAQAAAQAAADATATQAAADAAAAQAAADAAAAQAAANAAAADVAAAQAAADAAAAQAAADAVAAQAAADAAAAQAAADAAAAQAAADAAVKLTITGAFYNSDESICNYISKATQSKNGNDLSGWTLPQWIAVNGYITASKGNEPAAGLVLALLGSDTVKICTAGVMAGSCHENDASEAQPMFTDEGGQIDFAALVYWPGVSSADRANGGTVNSSYSVSVMGGAEGTEVLGGLSKKLLWNPGMMDNKGCTITLKKRNKK